MKVDLLFLGLLLGMGGAIIFFPAIATAQLRPIADTAPDLSVGTTVDPVTAQIDLIQGGSRPKNGINLFHSFQSFNVGDGRFVNFVSPAGVSNIFSRVTGTNPSQILGTLGIVNEASLNTISSANLFLINPNGLIFGPNSSLNVLGSLTRISHQWVESEVKKLREYNNHKGFSSFKS